jgi:hypothetical protein
MTEPFPHPVERYPLIVASVKEILYKARMQQRFREGLARRVWRPKPPVGSTPAPPV